MLVGAEESRMVFPGSGHGHRPVSCGNADIPPARGLYVRVAVTVIARRSGRIRRRSVNCFLTGCFSRSKSSFHQSPPSVMFQLRQIPVHRRRPLPFQRPELPPPSGDVDAHPLSGGTPTDAGGGRRMEDRPERMVQYGCVTPMASCTRCT